MRIRYKHSGDFVLCAINLCHTLRINQVIAEESKLKDHSQVIAIYEKVVGTVGFEPTTT